MPRLVKKTAHGPFVLGDKSICMCGLSKNQPFCDASHKKTLDEKEDKLYWYKEDGSREEIETDLEQHDGCCGGCCGEDGEEGCCHGDCCQSEADTEASK